MLVAVELGYGAIGYNSVDPLFDLLSQRPIYIITIPNLIILFWSLYIISQNSSSNY
jgi:hypothetical protein